MALFYFCWLSSLSGYSSGILPHQSSSKLIQIGCDHQRQDAEDANISCTKDLNERKIEVSSKVIGRGKITAQDHIIFTEYRYCSYPIYTQLITPLLAEVFYIT